MKNKSIIIIIIALICFISSIYSIGYIFEREDFAQYIGIYFLAFSSMFIFHHYYKKIKLSYWILLAISVRAILLFSEPNLSDDYYRFIWDGEIIQNGDNPYLILPQEYKGNVPNHSELLREMNSRNYYTVYPPVNQFFFYVATYFTHDLKGIVILFKSIIFLFEILTIIILVKLLRRIYFDEIGVIFYLFNPLVIIELMGNLHFEGVMIFFLLWSFWIIERGYRLYVGSVLFSLSVGVKLIPLIFIPTVIRKLKIGNGIIFGTLALILSVALFIPFANYDIVSNFSSSVELYFQKFEFNAGIYYIFREIGQWWNGYNMIQFFGKITPFLIIGYAMFLFYIYDNYDEMYVPMLYLLTFYYLISFIVHPWYIIPILVLSILSNKMIGVMWSGLIFISYYAYSVQDFHSDTLYYFLVLLEYIIVYLFLYLDTKKVNFSDLKSRFLSK